VTIFSTARFRLGQYEEAVQAHKRAAELEPENEKHAQEARQAEEKLHQSMPSQMPAAPAGFPRTAHIHIHTHTRSQKKKKKKEKTIKH
jgi:hypothetical protein